MLPCELTHNSLCLSRTTTEAPIPPRAMHAEDDPRAASNPQPLFSRVRLCTKYCRKLFELFPALKAAAHSAQWAACRVSLGVGLAWRGRAVESNLPTSRFPTAAVLVLVPPPVSCSPSFLNSPLNQTLHNFCHFNPANCDWPRNGLSYSLRLVESGQAGVKSPNGDI